MMLRVVVIPAYKPDQRAVTLARQVVQAGVEYCLVVDDGSGDRYQPIFTQLERIPNVVVLRHATNQGKGAALKTAFQHILTKSPEDTVVVTADGDGQHSAADILRVAEATASQPGVVVFGVRQFDGDAPVRNVVGNRLTSLVMKVFFGVRLSDTQTGLRGIPLKLLPLFLDIPYNRFEYEQEMISICLRHALQIVEVPITTIYLEENKSSHFNPLVDSLKIYFVLFRHGIAELLTGVVDLGVFLAAYALIQHLLLSMVVARGIAIPVNAVLRLKLAGDTQKTVLQQFPLYLLMFVGCGAAAFVMIQVLQRAGWEIFPAKLLSELVMYFLVFGIQKRLNSLEQHPWKKS